MKLTILASVVKGFLQNSDMLLMRGIENENEIRSSWRVRKQPTNKQATDANEL